MIGVRSLEDGSWTARWRNHLVHLRMSSGLWTAAVWEWPIDAPVNQRVLLEQFGGWTTAQLAANWACVVLTEHGASVLIDGKKQNLVDLLAFSPAPELVP